MNISAVRYPAVAAVLVLLAGCGHGTVPETAAITDAAGSGSASTLPYALQSQPITITPTPRSGPVPPTSPSPGSGSGAGKSAFCQDLNEQLTSLPNLLGQLGSADQRSTVTQQIRAANAKLVRDAPPEVRAATQTLARISNRIVDDVAATPPNIDDVSKQFTDPAYLNASAALGRYAGQHCGLTPVP
jgi:hypothetical protein